MEIVKYLCEFFFTNFWHWSGLLFVLAVIFCGHGLINIGNKVIENNTYKGKEKVPKRKGN